MKTIDINKEIGIKLLTFPDGQTHVTLKDIYEGDEVEVICSLTNSDRVLQLLQTANALDHIFANKCILTISYLISARSDRLMKYGDSFDLQVMTTLINSCGFKKVLIFDPHSSVSTALIDNVIEINNRYLVMTDTIEDEVLICPDAGAVKKVNKYLEWDSEIKDVVYCNKIRDLSTGYLVIKILEPEKCKDKNCIIVDDICDGGATFIGIAKQIQPKSLRLKVTHGIFSKGFSELQKYFQKIITTDSLCRKYEDNSILTVLEERKFLSSHLNNPENVG